MEAFDLFKINRRVKAGSYDFREVFEGTENCRTLWKVFGSKSRLEKVLERTKVKISKSGWCIIWISDKDGCININEKYFRKTSRKILYLDVIHELVHVKQFLQGKDLFDRHYSYVERPTEIEAYRYTVSAAKELNMSRRQLQNYLRVDWITPEEQNKLVEAVLGE